MKTALLTLLTCYFIFMAHVGCRPFDRSIFDGPQLGLNGLLSDENPQALLYFLKEKIQREMERGDPQIQLRLSKSSLSSGRQDLVSALSVLQTAFQEGIPDESTRGFLEAFSDRLKREDPPISIDLTFHILRQMIEIAKTQNQKHQAEQNRIIFDSVGK
ncbi:urocortin [Xenopus tropicalis]|uniref:Urocortin n=1 Tax=Xenopus tropicalis TaxID=8364 RepID=A0A803JFK1_XENTR|nr:urocortin [Xenopus tropicalis]